MKRLLIANRGEIARRIIRTARRMGIDTVAVYSDADAQALHVREAGRAIALGGNASADSYLRIDKIIAAAKETGADAVHPGYGFLSENAAFAQAVVDAGLTWVGPPAAAIEALGSKSGAKALARAHDVPCLPGYEDEDQSPERLAKEAERIGFPVMVKATAGGGGRGMRLVKDAGALPTAIESARSEALSAFGSGDLLLERALLSPRHVEVQVFADSHGNCIHLGERDCSVQRRHQKLIEETPSPAVDAALRERMGACAVALAKSAGYVGAGTVEFLLDPSTGSGRTAFYLMEMNTRLQVEHPVTEAVTGLDLVEWQIIVAQGGKLPLAQEEVRFEGHAVEVRLCAEDENFTPHAGQVRAFSKPPGVRFDHALFEGLQVPPWYDSMLGKIVVHAPTRAEAVARLAAALDETVVLGLPTNRRFLAACLRHPVFARGDALIPFLAEEGDALRAALLAEERGNLLPLALHALLKPAASLACPYTRPVRIRHRATVVACDLAPGELESAHRPAQSVRGTRLADGRWHAQTGALDLFFEDASFESAGSGGGGSAAAELRAPFNGKVIAVHATPGGKAGKGDVLVVIESMKLEHSLAAPADCLIAAVAVEPGQQVVPGQALVRFGAAP